MTLDYWATTEHLALDDDGHLWLRSGPQSDEPDRRLGFIGLCEVPDELSDEACWLAVDWADAGSVGDERDRVLADYRRDLI